jgi:single-stranded-DNA-specific exonuclease
MHQLLQEYIYRFTDKPPKKWDHFFTQLESHQVYKLSYINTVEKFCERVARAIELNETICIYSDYDTDAVTATATMYWGLLALGAKKNLVSFYVPDRFSEGYGMNTDAARKLSLEYNLIITVDCGINSRDEAEIFLDSNADLLITDHHHLDGEMPLAYAVVNPRLNTLPLTLEPNNEFNIDPSTLTLLPDSITGVGVAWFALVWLAYYKRDIQKQDINPQSLNILLPYVAIGTIADCQSIIEPINRLLVKTGLSILQKPFLHPGLEALTRLTSLREKTTQGYLLNSQDLGYIYAPILNSSGRITHASLSISTLLADTELEASKLAQELIETNTSRKLMVKDILNEVELQAKEQINEPFIWLIGDWNKGIIGLLASRLVNEYDKPVIVIAEIEGKATASLRAPEGFHLPQTMSEFAEYFEKAGGHPGAAGFSAKLNNLEHIKQGFAKYLIKQHTEKSSDLANIQLLPELLQTIVPHRSRIITNQSELQQQLFHEVLQIDPYGQDFPYPEFVLKLPELQELSIKFMGKESNHAKITFDNHSVTMFNLSKEQLQYLNGENPKNNQCWVGVKVSQNTWNGATKLELIANHLWLV